MMLPVLMRKKMEEMLPGRVLFDEPLSRHTSLGVGGQADALMFPVRETELAGVMAWLTAEAVPLLILGRGTNLLVKDGGFRGVVISLKEFDRVSLQEEEDAIFLSAGAGALLASLVGLALKEGLEGLEFCAGIPGSLGGAVRMNAGAQGGEIQDIVKTVTIMTKEGQILRRDKEDIRFRYRSLDLPSGCVILAAIFTLCRGARDAIRSRVEKNLAWRKLNHPLGWRSAGSIFKNPPDLPAGRLIDELGLKGLMIGDAAISEIHGNFIVNLGRAKAHDVLALIEMVRKKALQERGVILETEVHIVGEESA